MHGLPAGLAVRACVSLPFHLRLLYALYTTTGTQTALDFGSPFRSIVCRKKGFVFKIRHDSIARHNGLKRVFYHYMAPSNLTIVQQLFSELDSQLFAERLSGVCVALSERMTSAAGKYFPKRKLIRLSAPYLRLHGWEKTRRTLIHEMIHAFLDVQGKPCGHTPEFRRLLKLLTGETSIYHYDDMAPYARKRHHLYECPKGHRLYRKNLIRRTVSCGLCAKKFDPRYVISYIGLVEEGQNTADVPKS